MDSELKHKLTLVTEQLDKQQYYNALFRITELQQAILRKLEQIRHT